jgi:integrase
MARKSAHGLPPGIQLDQHGVYWATLEGEDAARWRKRFPGRSIPRRKAIDQRAALKLQRGLSDDIRTNRDPNAKNPKVSDWVRTCIDRKRKLADSTRRRYQKSLTWQIETLRIGRMRVQEVLRSHVDEWIDALSQLASQHDTGRMLSRDSIRNALAVLRMAFNVAVDDDMITKNPCRGVELPAASDNEIRPLTPEQVNAVLLLLDTLDRGKPHRLSALYHVAIRLGLRQSEIIGLRWKDIDFDRRELRVAGQLQANVHTTRGKTPHARRAVPLSPDVIETLRWHKHNQAEEKAVSPEGWNAAGFVFVSENGTPIRATNLRRQFDRILNRAGVPHVRFHDLRHTYAALSIAAGVELFTLSRRMGHSSISITADRYGHLYQSNNQDADALDRLLKRA